MKLKTLINLREKKEAIATSSTTNITLHFDSGFKEVGEQGTPEGSFVISVSSTGGKEYFRQVGDSEEAAKINEAIKLELRRAMRKFDKHVQYLVDKYNLNTL
jgi:hypothetical protein